MRTLRNIGFLLLGLGFLLDVNSNVGRGFAIIGTGLVIATCFITGQFRSITPQNK